VAGRTTSQTDTTSQQVPVVSHAQRKKAPLS